MAKYNLDDLNDSNQQLSWKRRPSEIRGYQRAFYTTTDDNDYLRVDYNLREKIVRLYIEISEEGGNAYYSVIKNGTITLEKSVVSGRSFGFVEKFRDRAHIFSTIPNNEVIKIINKNYSIDLPNRKSDSFYERKKKLQETRRKYFKPKDKKAAVKDDKIGVSLSEIKFIDLVDLIVGILLSLSIFILLQYDYIVMGVIAAFYGIIIGLVDMLFRSRPPILFKMLFFILCGTMSYMYGYLN